MSAKCTYEIRCDGCGKCLVRMVGIRGVVDHLVHAAWTAEREVNKASGIVERLPHRSTRHFCKSCADKPAPPHPSKGKKGYTGVLVSK